MPFLSLGQWLIEAYQPSLLIIAFAVSVSSLTAQTPKQMLGRATAIGFIALTINDVIQSGFDFSAFAESTFANFVGALFLACAVVSWTQIAEWTIHHLQVEKPYILAAICVQVCALGLASNAIIFYAADFFYRPLPVQIDAYLDAPLNGGLATNKSKFEAGEKPFALFPYSFDASRLSWYNPDGGLSASWHATNENAKFDLKIDILSGCAESEWIPDPEAEKSSFRVDDVRRMSISFDGGASDIWVLEGDRSPSTLSLTTDLVSSFGLEAGAKPGLKNVWQFIGDRSRLSFGAGSRALSFYAGRSFLEPHDQSDVIELGQRKLHVEIDGAPYQINIATPPVKVGDRVTCMFIASRSAFQTGALTLPKSALNIGVRVTITMRPTELVSRQDSELNLAGDSGWVKVDDINYRDIQDMPDGVASFIEAEGNFSIDVDGKPQDVRPTDRYRAVGWFRAGGTDNGKFRVLGTAKSLTKNERRLNPTKFESTKLVEQLTVLAPFWLMFLGSLLLPLQTAFRNDKAFEWVPRIVGR
ncbi:hypothetical protein [Mesorhizobium sp. M1E.F.Ca.ET.063.01.1.1]|uniref:hypothetical protein n=1 Tax=Mesorhizobium sp. M1E.F.Ca.ET.063.01.1.1 TaxID=2496750 RepID=UPI000FCA6754|nr:hypothetical protein [Mesorhizobium sp. M1E.F.Ca.ET.063.01.1.1]RUW85513.1 hypothetical protein EOA29_04465 [Mesorhizobium sp. M1E.F.Ca.ET.063.01.1.1]